jgi:hypothetical protein
VPRVAEPLEHRKSRTRRAERVGPADALGGERAEEPCLAGLQRQQARGRGDERAVGVGQLEEPGAVLRVEGARQVEVDQPGEQRAAPRGLLAELVRDRRAWQPAKPGRLRGGARDVRERASEAGAAHLGG